MNKADLYIIHKKEVVIRGDYINLARSNLNPRAIKGSSDGYHIANTYFVEEINVPVHSVVLNGETKLIAIEPELKELIEQPLLEEIAYQKRYSERVRRNSENLSSRIDNFNFMSKWQKIKFILRRGWV